MLSEPKKKKLSRYHLLICAVLNGPAMPCFVDEDRKYKDEMMSAVKEKYVSS